jgi:hypothetical protein
MCYVIGNTGKSQQAVAHQAVNSNLWENLGSDTGASIDPDPWPR